MEGLWWQCFKENWPQGYFFVYKLKHVWIKYEGKLELGLQVEACYSKICTKNSNLHLDIYRARTTKWDHLCDSSARTWSPPRSWSAQVSVSTMDRDGSRADCGRGGERPHSSALSKAVKDEHKDRELNAPSYQKMIIKKKQRRTIVFAGFRPANFPTRQQFLLAPTDNFCPQAEAHAKSVMH